MNLTVFAFLRVQFIENFVVQILNFFVSIVGNYGLAIIITTVIVRLLILPLSIRQERSMAKTKLLNPEIEKIKEKYKDDKIKMNEEMTKFYKENNINPLGGCLPLLIQLPIFIALYYTFMGDSIPNTATFLWFNLKQPDKLFTIANFSINILPIITAGLMIIQQKLMTSDSSTENSTQNAMLFMPVVMTVIFYNFPSGVNLYYMVNTLLSILQNRYVFMKVSKENE